MKSTGEGTVVLNGANEMFVLLWKLLVFNERAEHTTVLRYNPGYRMSRWRGDREGFGKADTKLEMESEVVNIYTCIGCLQIMIIL